MSGDRRSTTRRAGTRSPAAPPLSRGEVRAGRRKRQRRRTLLKTAVVAALVVTVGGGSLAYAFYEKLDGNIRTADVSPVLGDDRPGRSAHGALNIALIGSDSRAGTGGAYGRGHAAQHSDTLMVLHVSADRRWATAVSLPRDSWVEVPSCDLGDGTTSRPATGKINSAFAVGSSRGGAAGGAACAIKTVERNTGLRIDHFLEVDFSGFKNMVDALGGVPLCLPEGIEDTKAALSLPAGCQKLSGDQALGFARARYSLGDGSDIGRIGRQQELLTAILKSVQDRKLDAPSMYRLAEAATKSLTVDDGLGGLGGLLGLAQDLQAMPGGAVTFVTVPNQPRSLEVPSDKANVVWKPAAEKLFAALRDDRRVGRDGAPLAPADSGGQAPSDPSGPSDPAAAERRDVKLTVLNGTGVPGKAAEIAGRLAADGFGRAGTGNATEREAVTVVRYGRDGEAVARALAGALGIDTSRLRPAEGAAPSVTLVIGADHDAAGL